MSIYTKGLLLYLYFPREISTLSNVQIWDNSVFHGWFSHQISFLHEISWNDTSFFLLILNWQTLTPLSKSKRLFDPGQLRKFDFILKIGNHQAPIGTITEAKVIRERQPIFLKCIILKTCNVHKSSYHYTHFFL